MVDSVPSAPLTFFGSALLLALGLATPAQCREASAVSSRPLAPVPPVTLRSDTTYAEGRARGIEDARGHGEWGSAVRGLIGGALAGPLGAAIAYRTVDDEVELSARQREALRTRDSRFAAGYRTGFRERLVDRKRERALLGGIAGTGIFLAVVIHLVDLGGESADPLPPPTTPN